MKIDVTFVTFLSRFQPDDFFEQRFITRVEMREGSDHRCPKVAGRNVERSGWGACSDG